jgi:hypothetical protein
LPWIYTILVSQAPPANFVIEPLLTEEEVGGILHTMVALTLYFLLLELSLGHFPHLFSLQVFGSALVPSSANRPSSVPRTLIIPTPGSPISSPSLSNHVGLFPHVNSEVVIIPIENLPILNPIEDSVTNLDKFGADKTLGKIVSSQREKEPEISGTRSDEALICTYF